MRDDPDAYIPASGLKHLSIGVTSMLEQRVADLADVNGLFRQPV